MRVYRSDVSSCSWTTD